MQLAAAAHGKAGEALVCARHAHEQRARPRARRLHEAQPARHRALAEALGGAQPAPQERAVPLGDVDAELPHQSRRQGPVELAAQGARGRERGAEETLRKETPCPKSARSNALVEKRVKVSPPAPSRASSSARRSRTSAK